MSEFAPSEGRYMTGEEIDELLKMVSEMRALVPLAQKESFRKGMMSVIGPLREEIEVQRRASQDIVVFRLEELIKRVINEHGG